MKELDFDELDRAVNTLMGDASSVPAPRPHDDDDTKTLEIPSTLGNDQPIPIFTPPTESSVTPVANAPVPAARRGGRFMDVVHPSSDMKTSTGVAPRPVSRQGVTIAPSVPSRQPEVTAVPEVTEAPTIATEPQPWPDPLDMAGYQREPDTTTPAIEPEIPEIIPEVPTDTVAPTELSVEVSEPDDDQPLSTPFLSDAKVEKRPLGTNSTEDLDHAPVTSETMSEDETPDAENQLPAMPEPTPATLPAELQTDVLSIESDAPVESSDNVDEPRNETSDETKSGTVAATATSVGPTSIQQQYTEQPSTGDASTGGIYDTDSYHRPLAHPAKKKSGWMWVVWVLLLLILGAAGGAIAYLYLLK
jgi:hypothetical protein